MVRKCQRLTYRKFHFINIYSVLIISASQCQNAMIIFLNYIFYRGSMLERNLNAVLLFFLTETAWQLFWKTFSVKQSMSTQAARTSWVGTSVYLVHTSLKASCLLTWTSSDKQCHCLDFSVCFNMFDTADAASVCSFSKFTVCIKTLVQHRQDLLVGITLDKRCLHSTQRINVSLERNSNSINPAMMHSVALRVTLLPEGITSRCLSFELFVLYYVIIILGFTFDLSGTCIGESDTASPVQLSIHTMIAVLYASKQCRYTDLLCVCCFKKKGLKTWKR